MPQPPVPQVAVAWGPVAQTTPQPPQEVTAERLVSQPASLLQSANPAVQAPTVQAPAVQAGVALGRSQTEPQAPQLVTRARLTSQPSAALPLQSAKPSLQDAMAQAPVVHTGVALARAQALPQAPQWETSPPGVVSQPLETSASQSAKPALQAPTAQAPARAGGGGVGDDAGVLAVAAVGDVGGGVDLAAILGHGVAVGPRGGTRDGGAGAAGAGAEVALAGDAGVARRAAVVVAVEAELAAVCAIVVGVGPSRAAGEGAGTRGAGRDGVGDPAQATPHAPQWRVVVRAVSQPSRSSPLQLPKPVAQAERSQTPATQAAAAWSRTQAVPSGAVVGLEQRPLVGSQTPATVHAWRDARQITPAHSQASPWPSRSESRWSALACAGQLSSQSKTPSPSPSTAGRSMRNLICNTLPLRRGVKLTVSTERNSCWLRTTSTSAKPSSRVPPRVSPGAPGAPRAPRSAAAGTNTRTRYRALSLRRRFRVFQST
jgi:hypothetical protein